MKFYCHQRVGQCGRAFSKEVSHCKLGLKTLGFPGMLDDTLIERIISVGSESLVTRTRSILFPDTSWCHPASIIHFVEPLWLYRGSVCLGNAYCDPFETKTVI
jgi:hypothetical protein